MLSKLNIKHPIDITVCFGTDCYDVYTLSVHNKIEEYEFQVISQTYLYDICCNVNLTFSIALLIFVII